VKNAAGNQKNLKIKRVNYHESKKDYKDGKNKQYYYDENVKKRTGEKL